MTAGILQRAGLIRYGAGRVTIVNRASLEAAACECYGVVRQDSRGNLLVPMHDIGRRMWGVQRISETGRKLFQRDGRKQGTHAMLGELQPGAPLVIAEGSSWLGVDNQPLPVAYRRTGCPNDIAGIGDPSGRTAADWSCPWP